LSIQIDDLTFAPTLARAYVTADQPASMQVRVELFFGVLDLTQIRPGHIDVRLRSDAVDGVDGCAPMFLDVDGADTPHLCDGNLVFHSSRLPLSRCGTYRYTVEFSADEYAQDDPGKQWIGLADMAPTQDGVLVVSPAWVAEAPSMMEVCLRKLHAGVDEDGNFHSGHIQHLTAIVAELPVDVIYLLPFFRPGYGDLHTGEDVRKGDLGSPYAVADFYALDPDLVPDPAQVDLAELLDKGLFESTDVTETLGISAPGPQQLVKLDSEAIVAQYGEDPLRQLVARAHLRELTREAHAAGKRVIFDLVLMQTSRDNELILRHPEWYVQEADGRPSIHRIAWLEYSDVALFDLANNESLQQYLLEIAPYWIQRCDLDGVRIDASQTIERTFLSKLHNRIHDVCPDALVLGETLCPIAEAVDIPVDMIYALLVDFHRDAYEATPLIDFLEQMHSTFAAGTVAKAYFENHDSPRATAVWQERFERELPTHETAQRYWQGLSTPTQSAPRTMAVAKNLQATLINATVGTTPVPLPAQDSQRPVQAAGCRLAWALEWGSQWAELEATDFENSTLLRADLATQSPGSDLERAYRALGDTMDCLAPLRHGRVYYHRHIEDGDRVLAATRYLVDSDPPDSDVADAAQVGVAIVVLHNLDPFNHHQIQIEMDWLADRFVGRLAQPVVVYDSYKALNLVTSRTPSLTLQGSMIQADLAPLQSQFLRLDS
jgi:hypothetical protein